jgi:superfamily II DNA helicase RecQ
VTKLLLCRSTLNSRIESIKRVLAFRENDIAQIHPVMPLSEVAVQKHAPIHSVQLADVNCSAPHQDLPATSTFQCKDSTASTAESTVRQESPSIRTSVNDTVLLGKSKSTPTTSDADVGDDDHLMPASEADYWLGMEDVPMEDEPQMDVPAAGGRVPVAPASSNTPIHNPKDGPYYSEIMRHLRHVFGLTNFRPNQLEAITETLAGRDVFVLMPTGGGKSLCYQLPAVCKTGKTKGVTVVVSPLLALMKDQVHALIEKNVNVFLWNAEASWDEAMHRMRAGPKPSLMYITPEKLRESNAAQSILAELYRKKELARFVVDEAHCISTWGQDFRDAVSFSFKRKTSRAAHALSSTEI